MKYKLALINVIFMFVEAVCLFIPGLLTENIYEVIYEENIYVRKEFLHSNVINVFSDLKFSPISGDLYINSFIDNLKINSILLIVLLILSIAIYLRMLYRKKKGFESKRFRSRMPYIATIVLVVLDRWVNSSKIPDTVSSYYYSDFVYESYLNWLFYLILILQLLVTIFTFIINFKRLEENETVVVESATPEAASEADELKKYKELLDTGVITQEEFDAKKNRLLGL